MSMVIFQYEDGDDAATVSWTPEYGFVVAGSKRLLDNITFAIRTPAHVQPPEPIATASTLTLVQDAEARAAEPLKECVVCDHVNEHIDTGCTANDCECMTAVYP